jgi:hypothetical protein
MVRLFWVELLSLAESDMCLGSTIVPLFSSMSPGTLVPCFLVSVENRDLGWWVGTMFGGLR